MDNFADIPMTTWQDFIATQTIVAKEQATENTLTFVDNQTILLVQGIDAVKFLQGQVTCDIQALTSDERPTALGAHCTHKGRMIFSFRAALMGEDTIALRLHHSLIDTALESLGKYIVFSKAELIQAQDYPVLGICGSEACNALAKKIQLPTEMGQSTVISSDDHTAQGLAIRLGENRYELWLPTVLAIEYWEILSPHCQHLPSNSWDLHNIIDGLGEVRLETKEAFIPQMLNYQAVGGGISFTKGCYTGQEVVARMEYRGKLKRQMFRASLDSEQTLAAGAPLYTNGNAQAIGNIVFSANDGQKTQLLAVATVDAAEADSLYLDEQCQQKLHVLPLPYAITKET